MVFNESLYGKTNLDELAIFGGRPALAETLHVGRPNVGNREHLLERINDLLDRRRLTNNGPFVRELEHRIADLLGVKHCLTVSNGTAALELACQAAGLHDEVIVPSFTHISTVYALHRQGLTPVFCDCDPQTHNIDPCRIVELITPRTTGVLAVHLWGRPCAVDALADIARRRQLKLIYDAAHAFACAANGRMIGCFGDAETFSFHATKFFNTGEGGAVVTNDDSVAANVRRLRNTGFVASEPSAHIGTNAQMSELSAALGLTVLEDLDAIIAANYRNYKHYQQALNDVAGITLAAYTETERCNYQFIVVEVDEAAAHLSRDQLLDILRAENVLAQRYFFPGCHRLEPYRTTQPHVGARLAQTERMAQRVLCLPTGTAVSLAQVDAVCELIRFAVTHARAIQTRLPSALP